MSQPTNPLDLSIRAIASEAFTFEHSRDYASACSKHSEAIKALQQLVDDARFLDRERKRIGRKQIKFHNSRLEVLVPYRDGRAGKDGNLPVLLPTSVTANKDLTDGLTSGKTVISLVGN